MFGAMTDAATPLQTTATPTSTQRSLLADFLPDVLLFPGWQYVAAVVIVALGVFASRYVVRLLGRPIARRFRRQSIAQMVLRGIRVGTVLFSVFFAMGVLGIQIGNIVLSVTVFSAVLGIVLAPIVGSIINGLFVLADQPYEIGDMIELDNGTKGFVEEITLRYTKLFTLDNTFLVITNSNVRERDITNYSAEDERIRLSLGVLVTYESDIEEARQLIERAARECDEVIEGGPDIRIGAARYPAKPTCYIDNYADDGVLLTLRYWAKKPYKLLTVRSKVQTELWNLIEDADVEIAYPHQHLVFDETSGEAQVAVSHADQSIRDNVVPRGQNVDTEQPNTAANETNTDSDGVDR